MDENNCEDGLGCVDPEVHLFTEQSEDDVLNMFRQSQMPKRKDFPEGIMDAPAHHTPHLMFENAPKCEAEGMPKYSGRPLPQKEPAEITALWRKLSGVRPKENVEAAKV